MDAGRQSPAIAYLQIEIIQLLQQTAPHIIGKVGQVVMVYFIHRTAGLLHQLIADICFISGAVLPCQRFRNNSVMFFLHLPQIGPFGVSQFAGIRYIKDVFQIRPAPAVLVNQSDAL